MSATPEPTAEDQRLAEVYLRVLKPRMTDDPLKEACRGFLAGRLSLASRVAGLEKELAREVGEGAEHRVDIERMVAVIAGLEAELALWKPLTPEEAEKALDEAVAVPLSEDRIRDIFAYATDPANAVDNKSSAAMAVRITELESRAAGLEAERERFVLGFRSHLSDVIRRIGPARLPEDIRAELETMHNSYNSWADISLESQLAAARGEVERRDQALDSLGWRIAENGVGLIGKPTPPSV
jgi:hypothetical protein